ncbi:MAG: hypothetical protein QOE87_3103 [Gaiellales bacterium]|nr:hypothetical protein [Gaiellales bacterium]
MAGSLPVLVSSVAGVLDGAAGADFTTVAREADFAACRTAFAARRADGAGFAAARAGAVAVATRAAGVAATRLDAGFQRTGL